MFDNWTKSEYCYNMTLKNKEENFYVSYLPPNGFPGSGMWDSLTGATTTEETALYSHVDRKWYILIGDWRKEYEDLLPKGYAACVEFYNSKKQEHNSTYSCE